MVIGCYAYYVARGAAVRGLKMVATYDTTSVDAVHALLAADEQVIVISRDGGDLGNSSWQRVFF